MDRARTRASNTLDFLAFMDEVVRPGTRAHLRSALPPEVVKGLLDCLPTDWQDVETVHGPYVTELVRWLGPEAAAGAWKRYSMERLESRPAYRALVQGAVRLFGLSLGSFVHLMPRIFLQGFRDCFEEARPIQVDARHAILDLRLAPAVARYPAYATLFHGLLQALPEMAQAKGATLDWHADLPARRLRATFRW
ncbi:MAG: hypothetical protein QM767_10135 [Anaeromyxobacter sp.]